MPQDPSAVRCSRCGTVVAVPPEWRLVLCPKCGVPITRMDSDARYD